MKAQIIQDENKTPLANPFHQETNLNHHLTNPTSNCYHNISGAIRKFNEELFRLVESLEELNLMESKQVFCSLQDSRMNIDLINRYFDDFVLRK
jgi:hypothetical protein